MGKKVYRSILGIPIWMITALSIFAIFSVTYDLIVGDKNIRRYILLGSSLGILFISIILHFVPVRVVSKIAMKQMGK